MQDEQFLNDLIQQVQQGRSFKYLYFWGAYFKANQSCGQELF